MIVLDNTYFQGELYLAGLSKGSDSVGVARQVQAANENSLDWFINKYEIDFLNKLLGKKLAASFISGLAKSPVDPIWDAMKNALIDVSGKFKYSPIANYVYYYISTTGRTQTTMKGEVIQKQDHAENVDNSDKLISVWNDMYDKVNDFYDYFLFPNRDKYNEYSESIIRRYDFGLSNYFGI
jgi:hypothetical protein